MSNRQLKEKMVSEIKEKLERSSALVLTDYRGLTVAEVTDLRRQLREEGVEFKVLKNTLIKRAANELGYDELEPFLQGPTAIAFGYEDPVLPASIIFKFAKSTGKLEIKAGMLSGEVILVADVNNLASLPSKEVLLSQVLSVFQSPLVGVTSVLQANLRSFVSVLNAYLEVRN